MTANRMTSGEVLKYRKGERWVMLARYGAACPAGKRIL